MKLNLLSIATASALSVASMASATTVPEPADFVNDWHGVGSDHQANNQPGDTAVDRHNFLDATSGGSGKNPTANSAKRKGLLLDHTKVDSTVGYLGVELEDALTIAERIDIGLEIGERHAPFANGDRTYPDPAAGGPFEPFQDLGISAIGLQRDDRSNVFCGYKTLPQFPKYSHSQRKFRNVPAKDCTAGRRCLSLQEGDPAQSADVFPRRVTGMSEIWLNCYRCAIEAWQKNPKIELNAGS